MYIALTIMFLLGAFYLGYWHGCSEGRRDGVLQFNDASPTEKIQLLLDARN